MEQPTVVTIDRWSLCRGGPWSSLQRLLLTGGVPTGFTVDADLLSLVT